MEDVRSLRYGYLVHYYCLWCISVHPGYTTDSKFTVYLPWLSSSTLESYTVNTYPYRLIRGQKVIISIRLGFVSY